MSIDRVKKIKQIIISLVCEQQLRLPNEVVERTQKVGKGGVSEKFLLLVNVAEVVEAVCGQHTCLGSSPDIDQAKIAWIVSILFFPLGFRHPQLRPLQAAERSDKR